LAERLATDLVRHLSALPGIGSSIGSLAHVIEPILEGRRRAADLAERRRAEQDRNERREARETDRPRRATIEPAERPAPRNPTPASSSAPTAATSPQPTPIVPSPRPPEPEKPPEPGELRNPTAASAASGLEKVIEALGPLPESQKELSESLKPLTALGYTLKELVAAVNAMRQRAQQPQPQSPQPAPKAPTPASPSTPSPRPPKPGPANITPDDVRPTAPVPAPGAAAAAQDAGAAAAVPAEAEAGGAVAAGAAGGPAGLIAGIAVVATVGAAARAFSALTDSVHKVDRTFTELSSRLAPFNGRLAFAQAQARTQQTLLDIERAGRLGGDLAKFTDERARLSREVQRLATELESAVLPAINGAATLLADVVQGVRESVSAMSEMVGGFLQGMSVSEATTAAATKGMNKKLDAQEADRKAKEMMDIAGVFFGDPSRQEVLNIGGVDYGSASDWADYVPQAAPRRNNSQRAFGGI
jgi:hypothetical protein